MHAEADKGERKQLELQWRDGEKQSVLAISLLAVTKAAHGEKGLFGLRVPGYRLLWWERPSSRR